MDVRSWGSAHLLESFSILGEGNAFSVFDHDDRD